MFTTKIYVRLLGDYSAKLPRVIGKGDFIDLYCAKDTVVGVHPVTKIPLGVAMRFGNKGLYGMVVPRSSTPEKYHIWCPNSVGIIDSSYDGNLDEWKFLAAPIGCSSTVVNKGDKICQFSVRLSQKATLWQRLRWLLSSGVELVFVEDLGRAGNRGGFGTTGND